MGTDWIYWLWFLVLLIESWWVGEGADWIYWMCDLFVVIKSLGSGRVQTAFIGCVFWLWRFGVGGLGSLQTGFIGLCFGCGD